MANQDTQITESLISSLKEKLDKRLEETGQKPIITISEAAWRVYAQHCPTQDLQYRVNQHLIKKIRENQFHYPGQISMVTDCDLFQALLTVIFEMIGIIAASLDRTLSY
jgi:hypothetical protein